MIPLVSTSDTDLLSARAAHDVVPHPHANPARLVVDDLPALVEAADLAVGRPQGKGRAQDGGLDALVAVPRCHVGEIDAGTLTGVARERGGP